MGSGNNTTFRECPNVNKYCLFLTPSACRIYISSKKDRIHKQFAATQPEGPEIWIVGNINHPAIAQYLTKGKQVYAEGQPEARSFQRNDGTPGASLSLRVREVQLLGGRGDSAGGAPSYSGNTATASSAANIPSANDITEPIDDLPF